MKPTIVFCGYRDWALKIYDYVSQKYKDKIFIHLIKDEEQFRNAGLESINPKAVFFIGWSWIIKPEVVSKWLCICLHPSPLPKYRGGSPLQHQIINGESKSAITYFRMNDKIDAGDIIWQKEFSLDGDLSEILGRIAETGKEGMSEILDGLLEGKSLKLIQQDHSKMTSFKRRTPAQSGIKIQDFRDFTAEQLYNKIRALQDPYPNAFIVCKDNTRLYIKKAAIDKNGK
ncbi:methionyl-tRNA formyltransferase [Candidatus Woesearchaeota archaeon]|nr:methionyl-tRNA formyltransferase [Candidatus Woesearchaeota archaeon]